MTSIVCQRYGTMISQIVGRIDVNLARTAFIV